MFFPLFFWLVVLRLKIRLWLLNLLQKSLYLEIKQYRFSLAIKTEGSRVIRVVRLENGKVSGSRQHNFDANNAIMVTFKSPREALKISREVKEDKQKILEYIQSQQVKFEGDFSVLQSIFQLKEKLDNQG